MLGGHRVFAFPHVSEFDGHTTAEVSLGLDPNCAGGGACTIASFSVDDDARIGVQPNRRIGGVDVEFQEMTCGASCAPPSIRWKDPSNPRRFFTVWIKASGAELDAAFTVAVTNTFRAP